MRHRTAWKSSSPKQTALTALFWAFIRAIFTVRIPVTLPSVGNTLAIAADKVRLGTRLLHYKSWWVGISEWGWVGIREWRHSPQSRTVPLSTGEGGGGKLHFDRFYSKNKEAKSISTQLPTCRRTLENSFFFFFSLRGGRWSFWETWVALKSRYEKAAHYLTTQGSLQWTSCPFYNADTK